MPTLAISWSAKWYLVMLQAISKVGRERRRRWLNDKILRDMAGAMTAAGEAPLHMRSHGRDASPSQ